MPASIGLIRTDEKGGRGRGCVRPLPVASGEQRLRLVEPDDPWRRCSFEQQKRRCDWDPTALPPRRHAARIGTEEVLLRFSGGRRAARGGGVLDGGWGGGLGGRGGKR